MDLDISSLIIFVSLLAFLVMLLRLITQVESEHDACLNHVPGPRKLPLIGNLHQVITSFQPPHRFLSNLALKYGPMMYLKLGEVNTIIITSPELAREVLKTHDVTLANRPSLFVSKMVVYNNSDIAFSPYSEYWRQLRKICTIELLSTRRVQSFRPIREEESLNMCTWIASKEGSPINLTEKVNLTTLDTVMRASLGNMTEELTAFISIMKEGVELAAGFFIGDLYPSIKLFRVVGGLKRRVERLHKLSDEVLEKIINDHKVAAGEEQKQREDLVDVLLKFNSDGHELYLTIDNIKAVLQDMFIAGIETSSTTIDWAMAEMMRHPRVLKKVQDEVRQVFNDKGFVDESELGKLTYLKLVIKETLRMHPPIPLLLPRENYDACEINGFKIPVKTRVMVNAWAINRDPKHWEDAESFIPERYIDKSVDYKGMNFEYIPFGGGKRICPGMSFGLANVELPLAMLLYHFDWVLPHGTKPDMSESIGITARRKNPLYIIPVVRKSLSVK